jgi:Predicted metal binding domain
MRLDPSTNRKKFDREFNVLVDRRSELEQRGVHLLDSSTHPHIDLLFVPKHPLQVLAPQIRQGSLFLPAPAFIANDIPVFSASAFKARFDLSDYDLYPPSLLFHDPWTDAPLQFNRMFRAKEYDKDRGAHDVLIEEHPETHRPFLCLRGIREYHAHPQHSGDEWLLYRGSMNLFAIILAVWRTCIDLPHARLVVSDAGPVIQWAAEEKA